MVRHKLASQSAYMLHSRQVWWT